MPRLFSDTTHGINSSRPSAMKSAGFLLLACLLSGASSIASAQVMRCMDSKTHEVTYTNGQCISGETATQVQAAQSPAEIAQERADAAKALERSKAQMARDDAQRRQREEQERKEQAALARANANPENSLACRQARERYNSILVESDPDLSTWGERSTVAQNQMEMSCLGAAAYQQLQQARALQPNAINRPQWGYTRPLPLRPIPQPPAKIVNCNVFRCYDNRGGVHPIP